MAHRGETDLQTILANLARFSAPVPSGSLVSNGNDATTPVPVEIRADDPRARPQGHSNASPKPRDPAQITTWQEGLRCVTKIAAQNAQFAASIRKMMEDQRRNEMRWYAERQALKHTQVNRAKSSAEARSILRSLSKDGAGTHTNESPINEDVELASFDRKIHGAQVDMEASMTADLKSLGVPFFGTDPSLVIADNDGQATEQNQGERPKWSPIVTESQMLALRRRMIEHLEDLYRE